MTSAASPSSSSSSPVVPVAIFLGVTYEKDEYTKDHVLTDVAVYITNMSDMTIIDGQYASLKDIESNTERIKRLDYTLKAILEMRDVSVKVVYVYGNNKIFHQLSTLKPPGLRVIDVKTFYDLNLSSEYNKDLAISIVSQKIKEYPDNRYSMQSLINLCGLIAQNYVMRYSETEKKLFPNQRVNPNLPKCREYCEVNIFRVKLYNFVTFLLAKKYSLNFIEPLFQQMLLDMFYPNYYNFSIYPDIYPDDDKLDETHENIMNLEWNIRKMAYTCINHEGGLKHLEYLKNGNQVN